MYIEELLEVGVGLIFMWIGLALVVMGVQEAIASFLKLRARDMEKTIRRMLEEPPPEGRKGYERIWDWFENVLGGWGASIKRWWNGEKDDSFVGRLYDHPLIKSLSKKGKPDYVDASAFALALFDVVSTAGTEASVIQNALKALPEQAEDAAKEAIEALIKKAREAATDGTKLAELKKELEEFKEKYPELKPTLDALLQSAQGRLSVIDDEALEQLAKNTANLALSHPAVQRALESLIAGVKGPANAVEGALAQARTNVETWFDDTMAGLTGFYKRRAQVIGIIVGVVVAVLFNVDTVMIANTLWREPTLRQTVVAQAEKYALPFESEEGSTEAGSGVEATESMTGTQSVSQTIQLSDAVAAFKKQVEGLQLPIGWMTATVTTTSPQQCIWPWSPAPAESSKDIVGFPIFGQCWVPVDASKEGAPVIAGHEDYWLPKAAGWLLSGLAASFGAPFWFDVLKKLTNVRLAGKNPIEEEKRGGRG